MNAVDFINQNLYPRTILDYYNFKNIEETNDSIRACCAIHNGDNPKAFVWNKENNLWYCHTGDCGGGDVYSLVQKIEHISFLDAVKKVANILGLDITDKEFNISRCNITAEQNRWIEKHKKECEEKCNQPYEQPYTKYFDEYEGFNRFTKEITSYYGAKFCHILPTENKMYHDKLVIPLYDEEKQIGIAMRDLTGKSSVKWLYLPKHLMLKQTLYNYNNLLEQPIAEVILVEGIFDVWAYHRIGIDNVMAVYGSSLSKEQFAKLIELGVDIVTSFDNDDAGNKCTKQVFEMFKNKARIRKITLPPGKDPADCSEKELYEAYLRRE